MLSWLRRHLVVSGIGVLGIALLAVACRAADEQATAPAPSTSPSSAPTAAPAAPATPSAPAAAPAQPATPAPKVAEPLTATSAYPRPSGKAAQEFGWGELRKFPSEKLSLWTKAVYGGELSGQSLFTAAALDPLKFLSLSRTHNFGVLITLNNGRCSMVGRTDFSVCRGERTDPFKTTLVPMIIERWEQPDPKTYVFHVRNGVLWPARDGIMTRPDRTVTAEDIKWWFDIQKKEGILSANLALVSTVTVVDRRTVRIDFSEPYADFLYMLSDFGVGIFPRECYEVKDCLGTMKVVSPGPMLPGSEEPRVRQVWVKNEEFYLKGLPYHDRYITLNVTDPAAQKAAFITGKWYGYRANSPQDVASIIKQVPGVQVHSFFSPGSITHYRPQLKGPLADVRVRRALSLGVDRRTLWELGNGGFNFMGVTLPWEWLGVTEPFTPEEAGKWNRYDPDAAKALLAEAGYKDGFALTLEATASGTAYTPDWDLTIKEMWRKIGVTLNVKTLDATALSRISNDGTWQDLIGSVCWQPTCAGNTVDGYYLQLVSFSPQNRQKLNDPKIDALYLRQRSELDPRKRQAVHWEMQEYLWERQYVLVFGVAVTYMSLPPWEMNYQVHQYSFWSSITTAGGWMSMHDVSKYGK